MLAKQFGGKIVDLSNDSVIVEMAAKTERVDAFLKLVRPYGILEAARSGLMVMPRGELFFFQLFVFLRFQDADSLSRCETAPIASPWSGMADEDAPVAEVEAFDASLLPPG